MDIILRIVMAFGVVVAAAGLWFQWIQRRAELYKELVWYTWDADQVKTYYLIVEDRITKEDLKSETTQHNIDTLLHYCDLVCALKNSVGKKHFKALSQVVDDIIKREFVKEHRRKYLGKKYWLFLDKEYPLTASECPQSSRI